MMRPPVTDPTGHSGAFVVLLAYVCFLVQGLVLVSFPALGVVLTAGYGLTPGQYGTLFLPQVACAVAGAIAGGNFAGQVGLKPLLAISLFAQGMSQALLALLPVLPSDWAYPCLLAGTAALGVGFGFSGAPMNSYPIIFFPARSHTAVVAAHTLVGFGLAIGPVLAATFVARGTWESFPVALASICGLLAAAVALGPLPSGRAGFSAVSVSAAKRPLASPVFWGFVAIVILYAFAEGTYSSWAVIYLREGRGVSDQAASWALSAFWGALVLGRLVVSALVLRVRPELPWVILPLLMIAAFLLLPLAVDGPSGIGLFALAGIGCSAFLPLSITLASRRFPADVGWVASMLIAALMVGVGTGSFVVGALRELVSFTDLYRWSTIYPLLLLALIPTLWQGAGRPRRPGKVPTDGTVVSAPATGGPA